jgi:hypothetical protein
MPAPARPRGAALFACVLAAAVAACTGPSLTIESRDPTFVDGRRIDQGEAAATTLPFRYYGTTLVDTLPRDQDGAADFQRRPTRAAVVIDEPVTPWIYPFDFLGEVILRVTGSHGDQHFTSAARPAPGPTAAPTSADLGRLTQRALAARLER